MVEKILHSFEAGRRGKPDELDSTIAHSIGAHFLEKDPYSRFDIRFEGGANNGSLWTHVSGEVSEHLLTENYQEEISQIILDRYNLITKEDLLSIDTKISFTPQSSALATNISSGDMGVSFAVAYGGTPNSLPVERFLAVKIRDEIDKLFETDIGLRSDGKICVDALYEKEKLIDIPDITIAINHTTELSLLDLSSKTKDIVDSCLNEVGKYNPSVSINGIGEWTDIGGWYVDRGSREAKPPRDGFGSYGMVEDSFSGEDPTKPGATATFLARYIAVQLVHNDLAKFARVGLKYNIGDTQPRIVNIFTNGTSQYSQTELNEIVNKNIGNLSIGATIERFNLRDPQLYKQIVTGSDFFQDKNLPWNKKIKFR